jgi:hypothetical protein
VAQRKESARSTKSAADQLSFSLILRGPEFAAHTKRLQRLLAFP